MRKNSGDKNGKLTHDEAEYFTLQQYKVIEVLSLLNRRGTSFKFVYFCNNQKYASCLSLLLINKYLVRTTARTLKISRFFISSYIATVVFQLEIINFSKADDV